MLPKHNGESHLKGVLQLCPRIYWFSIRGLPRLEKKIWKFKEINDP
jgi:hypothetical protein